MIKGTYRLTPDIYPLHDVRVVDGDTLEARIALPFGQSVQKRIRLKGWWADEIEGPYGLYGRSAQVALVNWIAGKALWLHAPSCRMDKYGRVIGHLMHDQKIINPKDVLGCLQLSEKLHNAHRAHAKGMAGVRTAGSQSSEPINDPRAKCFKRNSLSGHSICCECVECWPKPPYRPVGPLTLCETCPKRLPSLHAANPDAPASSTSPV